MPGHHVAVAEQPASNVLDLRAEIRCLVEAGQVDDAKRLVRDELAKGDAARDMGRWLSVFYPPKPVSRPGTGRGDFIANMQWIEAHREAHRGEWVAMRDGALVASDPRRAALRERLARTDRLDGTLFVKVDLCVPAVGASC